MKQRGKYPKFVVVVVLAIVVLSGAGCKRKPVDPFPASNVVSGWQKVGDTRTFTAQDLWQYIDGDSERYIQAGVVSTSNADYKFSGKIEASVDVYTMSKEAGAQKIFEADPAGDAKITTVGDAARQYEQSLIFRKGPYLVRIVSFSAAPELKDAQLALAHAIEAKL